MASESRTHHRVKICEHLNLWSTRGCDGERSGVCVTYDAVCSERVPSGSLPFFDVGALNDSTTLHNSLFSIRVPRDSSLLCDRTRPRPGIYIYIYIRFASSSSVRCFVNTRDQQRSRTRKKNPPFLPPPPFGTRQRKAFFFLTSSYSTSFRIPRAFSCSFAARATLSR